MLETTNIAWYKIQKNAKTCGLNFEYEREEEDLPFQILGLSLGDHLGDWKNWLLQYEHRNMGECLIEDWIILGSLIGKRTRYELKVKNERNSLSLQLNCCVLPCSWSFSIPQNEEFILFSKKE